MPTLTTRPTPETLLLALDLGNTVWKLGFSVGRPAAPPETPYDSRAGPRGPARGTRRREATRRARARRAGGELLRGGTRRLLPASRAHRNGRDDGHGNIGSAHRRAVKIS
jgi:hypothetical protein